MDRKWVSPGDRGMFFPSRYSVDMTGLDGSHPSTEFVHVNHASPCYNAGPKPLPVLDWTGTETESNYLETFGTF